MQEEVLVVGGGAMGAGIAIVVAQGGYDVAVVEPDAASRERGALRATKAGVELTWLDAVPARSAAWLAIEAVPERFDLKRAVFAQLASALDVTAILATNTSSLSVADLADTVEHPERVVGLHFFNPPAKMQLVEIVERPENPDEVIDALEAFVKRIGKTSVLAADTPGFIVNRVARPFYLQSLRVLARNDETAGELDALARAAGFKMGPFELIDLIGLDVNLATSESVYARLDAERLAPVQLQRDLVSQGRLGRKSGSGFYDYAHGDPPRIDLRIEPPAEDEENIEEVVAVTGSGPGVELHEQLEARYASVVAVDDEELDAFPGDFTIVFDIGDGATDRGEIIAQIDARTEPDTIVFVDAYATDLDALLPRLQHPERIVGYGLLGLLESQTAVEIVDTEAASDDALGIAEELFASLGKGVMLVENAPGLFLGRVVGSIVNEALIAVHEEVASPGDVDTAMQLGVNYPRGPIEWGREIGGARIMRILRRLAEAEGEAFMPHRSLWILDVDENGEPEAVTE